MAIYVLYGVMSENMEEVKESLEVALNLNFEARESAYQGGQYFVSGKRTTENFVLKRNLDPIDGEPVELKFPEYPILLYINDTSRSLEIMKKIKENASQFALLKHQDL
ncbi:hypothetical protein [Herbaspirillum rubrisubalbicans]|uniref:hypothetical protein n=1 Tax=Herbaspirillum rubrisubalbicans TaxID=80842 RepID=UPI000380A977|nr:hypothetical protein [Herbaspirillum rubrisubalbicans]